MAPLPPPGMRCPTLCIPSTALAASPCRASRRWGRLGTWAVSSAGSLRPAVITRTVPGVGSSSWEKGFVQAAQCQGSCGAAGPSHGASRCPPCVRGFQCPHRLPRALGQGHERSWGCERQRKRHPTRMLPNGSSGQGEAPESRAPPLQRWLSSRCPRCFPAHVSVPRVPSVDVGKSPPVPYVYVGHHGEVQNLKPIQVVTACSLDIYNFPFDVQNCSLTFTSWLHHSECSGPGRVAAPCRRHRPL